MTAAAPDANAPSSPGRLFAQALLGRGRGWRLAVTTAVFVLHQLCEAAVPILIGVTIDRALVPGDLSALFLWLAVLGGVFVVLSWSYQYASRSMVTVYGTGEHDLRQSALARVLHPRGQSRPASTGDTLSLVTSDTYRVAGVAWSVTQQAATIVAIAASVTALVAISLPLGLAVLAGAILVVVGMHWVSRPLEARGMAEQSAAARASSVAVDVMAGLRVIVGMGAQKEAARRYRTASAASKEGAVRAARTLAGYSAISLALSSLLLAGIALASGVLAAERIITIGQLVTVLGLAQYLQGSLAFAGTFASSWAHKRASARRLHTLHSQEPLLPDAELADLSTANASDGRHPALAWHSGSTSLSVSVGETLGVVAGSPTRARKLSDSLGYRIPLVRGELIVFGHDALDLGPDFLRAVVAAPPHHGTVFSGTLAANLVAPGDTVNTAVLHAAALDDVIEQVGGTSATVGERGLRLSGGQRQRLLLGRALHTNAHVLVLDDPTSAVDSVTERRIADGLRMMNRSMIVISDSRTVLDACDRVVTLDDAENGW